ncbi:unnamed protein product [Allacma fusca]|uniref:Uncharacterized protein n=1 Tax=Allacma fusca TaxID=39272 RepID=A0A8J2PEM6_9HEXA|nr:unnamed protein product [Allacma fusca]
MVDILVVTEKETDIGNIEKMLRAEINQLIIEKDSLSREITSKEDLLEKARSGLEAAQQLNAQIEEKTRFISVLKTQGM